MITSSISTSLFNVHGGSPHLFVELFPHEEVGSTTMEDSPPRSSVGGEGGGRGGGRGGGEAGASMAESLKTKSAKLCGVCGDRAKSYHFGGISCDSCKAFFRRSVQNDAHRNFVCPYNGQCDISIASRKCCQQCRFQKCLSIGMEKSWVMTEEERIQLLRQRMERKARQETTMTLSPMASDVVPPHHYHEQHQQILKERTDYLSDTECAIIQNILDKYNASLEQVPYGSELCATNDDRSILDIISMLTTTIKRMTHFAGSLETFAQLAKSDQATLLRCSMIEVCVIRSAYAYDPVRECWPDTNLPQYRHSPYLTVADLRKLVSPELHQMHMKFNQDLRDIARLDETTYMLLLLVVLFSPDRASTNTLENARLISAVQDSYLALLRQHMNWHFTEELAAKLYPKLLLKLPDLRQVNDAHTQSHLQLTDNDITSIQRQFGNILCGYRIEGSANVQSSASLPPSPVPPIPVPSPPPAPYHTSSSLSSLLSDAELQQFHLFYPSGGEEKQPSQSEQEQRGGHEPSTKRKKPP